VPIEQPDGQLQNEHNIGTHITRGNKQGAATFQHRANQLRQQQRHANTARFIGSNIAAMVATQRGDEKKQGLV
jgi:hypothetical protein